jgi:ATP-dependent protease ClpP protease subunit
MRYICKHNNKKHLFDFYNQVDGNIVALKNADKHDKEKEFSKVPIFVNTSDSRKIYKVFLINEIEHDCTHYLELINLLDNATENDLFFININSPGGDVETGVMIVNAIRETKADVVTVLNGSACSMAALIFLSAEQFIVRDFSRLMLHDASYGAIGKNTEIKQYVNNNDEWLKTIFKGICIPFLTEQEMEEIFKGVDMWLLGDEVAERLKRIADEERRLYEEQEKEELELQKAVDKFIENYKKEKENKKNKKQKTKKRKTAEKSIS